MTNATPDFDQAYIQASEHWPTVRISPTVFESFIAEVRAPLDHPDLCWRDLYLAAACMHGNRFALVELDQVLRQETRKTLRSSSDDELDEMTQRLREKLLVGTLGGGQARLRSYRGTGSLRAWLRVCATRMLLMDRRKKVLATTPVSPELAQEIHERRTPERGVIKQQHSTHLRAALEAAMDILEPRERNVLRYQAFHGLSSEQIAKLYGVHRVTVARWAARAREKIFRTVSRSVNPSRRARPSTSLLTSGFDPHLSLVLGRAHEPEAGHGCPSGTTTPSPLT